MQVCIDIDPNCDTCKEILGGVCFTSLNIKTLLPSNTGVYLWVRDKFGNLYRVAILSEYDGAIIIDASDFPEGIFKLPQIFDIFISSDINGSNIFTIFSTYKCIKLDIS